MGMETILQWVVTLAVVGLAIDRWIWGRTLRDQIVDDLLRAQTVRLDGLEKILVKVNTDASDLFSRVQVFIIEMEKRQVAMMKDHEHLQADLRDLRGYLDHLRES